MTGLWFRRLGGMDSDTMREIAREARVSWDPQSVVYAQQAIGYADGDPDNETEVQAIIEAAYDTLGVKPVQTSDPRITETETE